MDVNNLYTLNIEPYVSGQPDYLKLSNKPRDVVNRIIEPFINNGRNLTADNWFSSPELIKDLKSKKTTFVGTVNRNRRYLPASFKNNKRKIKSVIYGYNEDSVLLSYIPKKYKLVNLISSLHNDGTNFGNLRFEYKPEIIKFYNRNKFAVNVVDWLCDKYNTARRSNRWPWIQMFYLINVACQNSKAIYEFNNKTKVNRKSFLENLAYKLMKNWLEERSNDLKINFEIRKFAASTAGINIPNIQNNFVDKLRNNLPKQSNCLNCEIKHKTRTFCEINNCKKFVCSEGLVSICLECFNNLRNSSIE